LFIRGARKKEEREGPLLKSQEKKRGNKEEKRRGLREGTKGKGENTAKLFLSLELRGKKGQKQRGKKQCLMCPIVVLCARLRWREKRRGRRKRNPSLAPICHKEEENKKGGRGSASFAGKGKQGGGGTPLSCRLCRKFQET